MALFPVKSFRDYLLQNTLTGHVMYFGVWTELFISVAISDMQVPGRTGA